ncbi:MAG: 4-hydroxythreonine-4-phosphate dehydrogenase PdxA [Calditrichia bacterium]
MNIGITLGDPAGIGPEIVYKTLLYISRFQKFKQHSYYIFCPEHLFRDFLSWSDLKDFDTIRSTLDVHFLGIDFPNIRVHPGTISAETGNFSAHAFKKALAAHPQFGIQALVTGPIDKHALKLAGVNELDHSQMISNYFWNPHILTMFFVKNVRIYFYTKHIPLRDVSASLDNHKLKATIRECYRYESLFGKPAANTPFAIAGLNPHAGDSGRFGDEEITILSPVINELKEEGYFIEGPVAPDSVFHLTRIGKYSGVLSLYHDQGHIAAKCFDFYRTVSFSLGAPILRTSVDHGSALDISGQNIASPVSFIAALNAAIKFGRRYSEFFRNNFEN